MLQNNCQRQKKLFHITSQARIRLFTSAPNFKYGFEVHKDYAHGIRLKDKSYNSKWQDITELEMKQLNDYQTFNDLGLHAEAPEGFKKIRVHLIFVDKHDCS